MKASHFIAPALALIAIIFIIDRQENTLAVLRNKTDVVRDRLDKFAYLRALADPSRNKNGDPISKTDKLSLPDGSPDWEGIFELSVKALKEGGMWTDLTDLPGFQKRIAEMNEDEIAEGMTKIQSLDLNENNKRHLKCGLLLQLAGKNPQLTLELIGDAISERKNPLSWTQQFAYSKFVKTDPDAAMAWLDRQPPISSSHDALDHLTQKANS